MKKFIPKEIYTEFEQNKHLVPFKSFTVFSFTIFRHGIGGVRVRDDNSYEIGTLYRLCDEIEHKETISETNPVSSEKYYWRWEPSDIERYPWFK